MHGRRARDAAFQVRRVRCGSCQSLLLTATAAVQLSPHEGCWTGQSRSPHESESSRVCGQDQTPRRRLAPSPAASPGSAPKANNPLHTTPTCKRPVPRRQALGLRERALRLRERALRHKLAAPRLAYRGRQDDDRAGGLRARCRPVRRSGRGSRVISEPRRFTPCRAGWTGRGRHHPPQQ